VKLKRATYRHIEAEIYSYEETRRAMKQLRLEIMYEGRRYEEGMKVSGGGPVSSIVERRATRLANSILLREMERITGAIAATYLVAKEEARKIIWIKYGLAIEWEPPAELKAVMEGRNRYDMSVKEMADLIPVAESTFYQYKTGFVYGIAERLGWY